MIKEFALDPEAITSSFREFCYFTEKFGISQGRVISRFPKDWKRLVYESAQNRLGGTTYLSRLEVKLRELGGDVLFATGRPGGDGSKPWVERALTEHARAPFDAIITEKNSEGHPAVVLKDDVDKDHPHFANNHQFDVPRTSQALIGCADFLLRYCQVVKLVDPHFDPFLERFKRPLKHLFARLVGRAVIVEVHRNDQISDTELLRRFSRAIPPLLPPNVTLQLFVRPVASMPMHNRFIMTESGGVKYGVGLDDNEDGGGAIDDDVDLMDTTIRASRWKDYTATNPLGIWP